MGTGKSTIGKILAKRLEISFIDSDSEIEKDAGRSISEIFSKQGEGVFRDLEKKFVTELLPETPFYKAEEEHHNYYNQNKEQGYCSYIISPKIQKLKQNYQHLLKSK